MSAAQQLSAAQQQAVDQLAAHASPEPPVEPSVPQQLMDAAATLAGTGVSRRHLAVAASVSPALINLWVKRGTADGAVTLAEFTKLAAAWRTTRHTAIRAREQISTALIAAIAAGVPHDSRTLRAAAGLTQTGVASATRLAIGANSADAIIHGPLTDTASDALARVAQRHGIIVTVTSVHGAVTVVRLGPDRITRLADLRIIAAAAEASGGTTAAWSPLRDVEKM